MLQKRTFAFDDTCAGPLSESVDSLNWHHSVTSSDAIGVRSGLFNWPEYGIGRRAPNTPYDLSTFASGTGSVLKFSIPTETGSQFVEIPSVNFSRENSLPNTRKKLAALGGESGQSIEIYSEDINTNGDRVFSIGDSRGNTLLSIPFRATGQNRYKYDGPPVKVDTPAMSEVGVAGLMTSLYISFGLILAKRVRSKVKNNEETQARVCDRLRDGTYQFGHDFMCTIPVFGEQAITRDGRMYMYVFCLFGVERIEINVLDCCKEHDVDLWCAGNYLEAEAADQEVIACVTGHVLDQGLGKLSPLCGMFVGGYAQLAVQALVGQILFSVLVGTWTPLVHQDPTIGWRDINKESCLCGGDAPTTSCSDPCIDLCSTYGKKSNCNPCRWKCRYDPDTGRTLGIDHIPNEDGSPCCPGTQNQWPCRPDARKMCGDKSSYPTCWNCEYECDYCTEYHWKHCPRPYDGKLVINKPDHLPCCTGTPEPFEGYCPKYDDSDRSYNPGSGTV